MTDPCRVVPLVLSVHTPPLPDCDHASRVDGEGMQRIAAYHRERAMPAPLRFPARRVRA